jgi:hypothetical protein
MIFRQVTSALLINAVLGSSLGAAPKVSTQSLLTMYNAAACIPPTISPNILPKTTRSWHAELALSDGSKILIKAAEMPGGLVTVTDLSSGERFVAANAGDYVYPDDIRIDKRDDRLYVIARGLAGGIWRRTVLFQYNLQAHRQTARRGVRGKDLPKACPGP